MISPLNNSNNVSLIHSFDSDLIIRLYKKEIGIDVAKFFENIPKVLLYECNESKYRFYYPFFLEGTSDFYKLLSTGSETYYPGWKWENEVSNRHITAKAKVLDIGCGDGTFLSRVQKEKQSECYGIEFNQDAIKKCLEKGLVIYDQPTSIFAEEHKEFFDIVTSFQVLEHISNIKDFINDQVKLVRSGGRIIIGVPYNNPYLYRQDKYHILNLPPHHMGLWNEVSLSNLTKYFPIEVKNIYIEELDNFVYFLFVNLHMIGIYKTLFKVKIFRFFFRATNSIFRLISKRIKGRNIVVIFEKL